MCDECTWHHKTFLVQLYRHLAIKLNCTGGVVSVASLLLGVATDVLTRMGVVSVGESGVSVVTAGRRVVPVVHALGRVDSPKLTRRVGTIVDHPVVCVAGARK